MAYRNYSTATGHIVDQNGFGDFKTITTAMAAAVSGQTIFLRPGTYTENFTITPGVNLVAWTGDANTPHVIINGTVTMSGAGISTISNVSLQTNSLNSIVVSGSAASILNISNCFFNFTNTTGISFTSSSPSAQIFIEQCFGNLGTTGITYFTSSSAGNITIFYSNLSNSGSSTTASTISAGTMNLYHSNFTVPITTSSTSAAAIEFCVFVTGNTTCLTIGGTGASGNNLNYSFLSGGTASALSVGSTLSCNTISFSSTNTNAVTGAGTLTFANLIFPSTSSLVNTTLTLVPLVIKGGFYQGNLASTAPSSGQLGEQIRATIASGSAVGVLNNTVTTVTSINLTAGVWDITGIVAYNAAAITGTTFAGGVSITGSSLGTGGDNALSLPTAPTASSQLVLTIPVWRQSFGSTTTVFLQAFALFTVGTLAAFGRISATRVA